MDRRQIGLVLTLDALGIEPNADSFEHRLIAQKAIYIAQQAGVDLGYFFRWYLHGPYDRSVTDDLYGALDDVSELQDIRQQWSLNSEIQDCLGNLKPLLELTPRAQEGASHDDQNVSIRAERLELLGSVLFLAKRVKDVDRNPKHLAQQLRAFGKEFTDSQVTSALDELGRYSLL